MNKNKLFRKRKRDKEERENWEKSILAKDEWGRYVAGVGPKPFEIGLINYPRFPSIPDKIMQRAYDLADHLLNECCQHSYLIMNPEKTIWHSRRKENVG